MEVTIIAAVATNYAIGKNNDLLWHLPKDMQFFKKTTSGHFVIMGRKNFYSIPEKFRPLPNRTNIVVSRRTDLEIEGVHIFSSVDKALDYAKIQEQKEVFVIGGGQVYNYFLHHDLVSKMLITHVTADFEADVFFPEIDQNKWHSNLLLDCPKDDRNPLDFSIIEYRRK
ncbi:MAG: dihydrofolate reductase [Bacteroidota bacterium]